MCVCTYTKYYRQTLEIVLRKCINHIFKSGWVSIQSTGNLFLKHIHTKHSIIYFSETHTSPTAIHKAH